jgi:hypothetical protein
MAVLLEVVSEKELGLAQYFTRYQDLVSRIEKLNARAIIDIMLGSSYPIFQCLA